MTSPAPGQVTVDSPGLPTFADLRAFVEYLNNRLTDPGAVVSSHVGTDGLTVLTVEGVIPANH